MEISKAVLRENYIWRNRSANVVHNLFSETVKQIIQKLCLVWFQKHRKLLVI